MQGKLFNNNYQNIKDILVKNIITNIIHNLITIILLIIVSSSYLLYVQRRYIGGGRGNNEGAKVRTSYIK